MDDAYTKSTAAVLQHFGVTEAKGLSDSEVRDLRKKHGVNALPEEPPTPIWELILEQFKDQLVLILLGSAAVSFVLALLEGEAEGWTAFVDPAVVRCAIEYKDMYITDYHIFLLLDPYYSHPQRHSRSQPGIIGREGDRGSARIQRQRGNRRSKWACETDKGR
jgi:hypothetical protein